MTVAPPETFVERPPDPLGPSGLLLRSTALRLRDEAVRIGVDPRVVLRGLLVETRRARYSDDRANTAVMGELGVRTWERAARDRLRRERLRIEDQRDRQGVAA